MIPSDAHARYRVKRLEDPPGCQRSVLEKAEGPVARWLEFDEVLEGFSGFVYMEIETAGEGGAAYVGDKLCFRQEDVEEITG